MRKTWLVAWREFTQRLRSRGFLIASLSTPLMLVLIWAIPGALGGEMSERPAIEQALGEPPAQALGYVDDAALIRVIPDPVPSDLFRAYPDEAAARAAMDRGEIGAYYLIPPDYRETGRLQRVCHEIPSAPAETQWIDWVLTANLMPEARPEELARLRWPFGTVSPRFVSLEARGPGGTQGNIMLPFLMAVAVMVPLFSSGGYLLQSLTQEKSNRVMEILLLSLRPRQLLAGKIIGLGALALVQYIAWGGVIGAALALTRREPTQFFAGANLTPPELALIVAYALGGFMLYAALMAGLGALAPSMEGSRTWVFIITLPALLPIYLWLLITTAPNGTLAVALSLIPLSAPIAMLMRLTRVAVPPWQIILSLALLGATGLGMIWLMAHLFHVQTLLSGEALSLRRIRAAFRGQA